MRQIDIVRVHEALRGYDWSGIARFSVEPLRQRFPALAHVSATSIARYVERAIEAGIATTATDEVVRRERDAARAAAHAGGPAV